MRELLRGLERIGVLMEPTPSRQALPITRLLWWTLFACAFGYVEAAVVIYLRRATGMPPGQDYPAVMSAKGLPFASAELTAYLSRQGVLPLELTREAATIVLLFSAAWASGRSRREKWGLFGFTFAVWDLSYYLFLSIWLGFPRSLLQTDIYFLIPFAWYGPVWFPVLVVMPALIIVSLKLLCRPDRTTRPALPPFGPPQEADTG
jgi:hypothetical protein